MPAQSTLPAIAAHGAKRLPSVEVDSYNVELKDDEGFIGDRASKGAFRQIIENWRVDLRKLGADPLSEGASEDLTKKRLDDTLFPTEIARICVRASNSFKPAFFRNR